MKTSSRQKGKQFRQAGEDHFQLSMNNASRMNQKKQCDKIPFLMRQNPPRREILSHCLLIDEC